MSENIDYLKVLEACDCPGLAQAWKGQRDRANEATAEAAVLRKHVEKLLNYMTGFGLSNTHMTDARAALASTPLAAAFLSRLEAAERVAEELWPYRHVLTLPISIGTALADWRKAKGEAAPEGA